MAKVAFIFGFGGHARVVASLLAGKYSEIRFVVTTPPPGLLSEEAFFQQLDDWRRRSDVFLGIGDNVARRRIFERLLGADVTPKRCVSDAAFVAPTADLGDGIVICPGVVIMAHARLGDNVIVNTLSSIDHDCSVGDHSQVTAGVTFGGTTRVGQNCFFGIKSATIPGVTIGDNVVVMAGSLVTKDAPAGVVLGGYPAAIVKRNI